MCGLTVRPSSTAFFASRPAASSTPGLEVLVQEVIAAISTSPLLMSAVVCFVFFIQVRRIFCKAILLDGRGEKVGERTLHLVEVDPILRTLRAGQRRHHG